MADFRRLGCALGLAVALSGTADAQQMSFFSIGSGDPSGAYFATTRAICAALNRDPEFAHRCSPEPTAGSLYNLKMLAEGQLEFALAQSDWHRAAHEGTELFESGAITELRSVLALYKESITVLVRRDSEIMRQSDLVGRRIDIGPPASGRNGSVRALLGRIGFAFSQFAGIAELPAGAAVDALCSEQIDATILLVGHPNRFIAGALETCPLRILQIEGPDVIETLQELPDYEAVQIPAGTYSGMLRPINTFAVTATLVTRADVDPDLVAQVTDGIIRHLPTLQSRSPLLAELSVEEMATDGLTAPLHPGAEAALAAVSQAPAD